MRRTEFLENELAEAKFDIIGLSCRVTRAEDVARDLDEQINELRVENERHKNMISSLTTMLQSKIDLIEEQEKEIYELDKEKDRLHYRLDNALEEIRDLEDRLSGAE